MTFHEQAANLLAWFWIEFANHLWQSTLFFLLVMGSAVLLGGAAARARYLLWLIASAKFVLPLSIFVVLGKWLDLRGLLPQVAAVESPVFSSGGGVSFMTVISSVALDSERALVIPPAPGHNEIYCVLTLLWIFGCAALFALWRKRSRAFRASLATGEDLPVTRRDTELLKNARMRIGFSSRADLIISGSLLEPVVWGVRRPVIVIPRGLPESLTDDEYELILMHELAHVGRRDNLIGVLQMALCCLLWFHPLVWFIRRKLLKERELACDEAVIRYERQPRVYAGSLLKVVRFGLHSQQSAGLAKAAGSDLRKRLELIMRNKIKNTNSRWPKWVVRSMAAALVLLCIVAGFTTAQTGGGRIGNKFLGELTVVSDSGVGLFDVEIYAGGKLYHKMELNSPTPDKSLFRSSYFQYGLYRVPEGDEAQTAEGRQIYAFQLIPTPTAANSVKVEIVALLEDLKTVSSAHPLHEFKKQPVATYDLQVGQAVTVSEMSKLGIEPLGLKVVKFGAGAQNSVGTTDYQDRSELIRQIQSSPNVPYRIVGNDDCPVKITEAAGKEITASQFTQLTGTVIATFRGEKEVFFPNVYSVPEITMLNTSGKTITGYMVGISEPEEPGSLEIKWRGMGQGAVFKDYPKISIAPGETFTIKQSDFGPPPTVRIPGESEESLLKAAAKSGVEANKYWLIGFTDKSNFYVSVAKISFDDNTTWTAKEVK